MTDAPPDYTTMSGAEFQRAVGTDPDKWAEAFMQCVAAHLNQDHQAFSDTIVTRKAFIADWFRDCMAAAVKAHPTVVVEWGDRDAPEKE